jgi:geranylgeranyl diphosphate synthase type I
MDIHLPTVEYLSRLRIFATWQEMGAILRRSASTRPRDWHLPVIACQAAGGSPENAIPASAALACTQISIILADDMLDDDPRGEYRRIGHGRAANYAIAFQAAGVDALLESRVNLKVREDALKSLNEMMSGTAFGQELDVQNPSDETAYWSVVKNKSAPFYGCAFHLGALFGGAKQEVANGLKRLGGMYGEMIQIHDDLNDTLAVPANSDWIQGRKPLPILYALSVDHPARGRFMELFQTMDPQADLQEAQGILIRCGAVSYCVDQLLHRHREAQTILESVSLFQYDQVAALLDEIIAPVRNLFGALGLSGTAIAGAPGYRQE